MRLSVSLDRTIRMAKAVSLALMSRDHPLLVDLVATRCCTLSCGYCSEYGPVSRPVPSQVLFRRIDRLQALGTASVRFTGEPLNHPELAEVVGRVRQGGMFAALTSNGTDLTSQGIETLAGAGVDHLHITASTSTLAGLAPRLDELALKAEFSVTLEWVMGGRGSVEAALSVARRARALGFVASPGIDHEGSLSLRPLDPPSARAYEELRKGARLLRGNRRFLDRLVRGLPNEWNCRAGARYLYLDEHGFVHYCAEQRGKPGISLDSYGVEDIRREYDTVKPCAGFCTVSCVQQIAFADSWRAPQKGRAELPRLRHIPLGADSDDVAPVS